MTHKQRRIARLIQQLETRVTDLEQSRPPETPERRVENVTENGIEMSDTVSSTQLTDIESNYDQDNYGTSEYS